MPKKKETDALNTPLSLEETTALQGIRYCDLKGNIKRFEGEAKKLRAPLERFLEDHGENNKVCVSHADIDVILKHTIRVSKVLKDNAIDVLRAKGLSSCVKTIEVVDEEALEAMYAAGKLSDDDIQDVYSAKTSKAFSVEVKNQYGI